MENPIKMDDLGRVQKTLFLETLNLGTHPS